MARIVNQYKKWKYDVNISNDMFYDVVLSNDVINYDDYIVNDNCLIHFDKKNENEHNIAKLNNFAFNGIDNGSVWCDYEHIDNDKLIALLSQPYFFNDTKIPFSFVSANTQGLSYEYEVNEDYTSFKGGFMQGFFKEKNSDFELFKPFIEDEWNLHFELRPIDYVTNFSVNNIHPENAGIFFYIGLRNENKFAENFTKFPIRRVYNTSLVESPFEQDYLKTQQNDVIPQDVDIKTNDGYPVNNNLIVIQTDNKYIFFNNTKEGFKVNTWDENTIIELTGETHDNLNLYLYADRTKSGYTVNTIDALYSGKTYNVIQDITNNSFGLKYNEDGSIEYRYIVKSDNCFDLLSEKTLPIIKKGEWNNIDVKIKIINGNIPECQNDGRRLMKIFIYKDNKLKFISKPLPEFDFRMMNIHPSLQEGVPYSISIGGGSLGLMESIWFNQTIPFNYILPIEQYFAGTFIGDIKACSLSTCPQLYSNLL